MLTKEGCSRAPYDFVAEGTAVTLLHQAELLKADMNSSAEMVNTFVDYSNDITSASCSWSYAAAVA